MIGYKILSEANCTVLSCGIGYSKQFSAALYDILTRVTETYRNRVNELRALGYGSDEYKEAKKSFPCFIPTGVFKENDVHDNAIISYSNIIVIDIDKSDNPNTDFSKLRKDIFKLPYVLAVSDSIGGQGIYAIVYVKDGKNTKSYCKRIECVWNSKFNIVVDGQCKNLARKRFISYDDDLLIKKDEDVEPWTLLFNENKLTEDKPFELTKPVRHYANEIDKELILERVIDKIVDKGYSADDYNSWISHIYYLNDFDNGYNMFLKISRNSASYKNEDDVQNQWNRITKSNSRDDAYRYYFGIAKRMLGPGYYKEIINELKAK